MSATHAIGIDPGLDGVGMALCRCVGGMLTVQAVATVRTRPADPMGERLRQVHEGVQRMVLEWEQQAYLAGGTTVVVLEVPTHTGRSVKAKRAGGENVFAADMSRFWQALGVIRLALAGILPRRFDVDEAPPGNQKKGDRQAQWALWTQHGRNGDERDAIVLALARLVRGESVAATAQRSAAGRAGGAAARPSMTRRRTATGSTAASGSVPNTRARRAAGRARGG